MKNNELYFQKIIDYSLLAVFFLFPLTLNLAFFSNKDTSHPLLAINFSIADLLISLVTIIWLVKVFVYQEWQFIKYPPKIILFFVFVGFLSVVNASAIGEWLKEFIKIFEYFVLFYLLLINNLKVIDIRVFKNCLFILTSIALVIAIIQYAILKSDNYFIRAFFINENVYGTFISMITPLVFTEFISCNKVLVKVWMLTLLILTVITLSSGSALLAILVVLFIISLVYNKKVFLTYLAFLILGLIGFAKIMPASNVTAIKQFFTIYEQGNVNTNYYTRLAMLAESNQTDLINQSFGEKTLIFSTKFYFNEYNLHIKQGNLYRDLDHKVTIKNRFLEMQAAVNMLSDFAPLGVGIGNFQNNIGMYYKDFPKVNTAEPEQHNQFLLVASTSGLIGLASFISILVFAGRNNWKKYLQDKQRNVFSLSLLGSIISVCFEGMFSSFLTSSLLVPFIFILFASFTNLNHAENRIQ